jgi:hypothetical protein
LDKHRSYHGWDYPWARTLELLNEKFFSKDRKARVSEVLECSDLGIMLILYYADSTRLAQLSQLSSLWDCEKISMLAPDWTYSMDCSAVIEDNTLIFEVARATLTVRCNESIRQSLIKELLVLRWIGTAILNKGALPTTSVQMLGHIVVDYEPGSSKKPPIMTSNMVPDYQDIPITVHNLYVKNMFSW